MACRSATSLASVIAVLALASAGTAAEYHVGPGQPLAQVTEVPWEKLNPGDTVFIHWRSAEQGGDYHEKINLTRSGEAGKRIRIVGVKGPKGERPCLNGKDAVTRTTDPQGNSTYFGGNQDRGVLCFSGRNGGAWQAPGANYWEVTGLKITGARPAHDYTDSFGKKRDYQRGQGGLGSAGAGVFIDRGNFLRFSDLELTDNNNGFFGSSDDYGSQARHVHDILLENSLLYGNGAPNNASVHNAYVEAANFTVRNNWFGRLVEKSGGSHLKDRGANVLIEGNFFDDASVPLFLDPPEDSMGWMKEQPGFDKITVRNNVFRKPDSKPFVGQDIVMVGFDGTVKPNVVRTVEFSHNTFIFAASRQNNWSITIIDLLGSPQVIKFEDNVFLRYIEGADKTLCGITFIAKVNPVDGQTVVEVGENNYIPMLDPWREQNPQNGTATVKGFDKVTAVDGASLAGLETKYGLNLHDPAAPDYGRFDAARNVWFQQHKAGATLGSEPSPRPMAPVAGPAGVTPGR